MDYQQVGSTKKFKKPSKNDRNTLNKIEDKRTLKASLVDWKDQEHPSADWKSLRKLPCESRSLTKSLVSWRTPPWVQGIRKTPLRVVKKGISPKSWGNSLVSRINTSFPNSPINHEGEEENFPQWTTHYKRLPRRSKLQRRLPRGPPTHSSVSYSPQCILHQGLPRELELPRPLVHISCGNWICRHKPYTS